MSDVQGYTILWTMLVLMAIGDLLLLAILRRLRHRPHAISATLTFKGGMMPATIVVGGKGAQATYQEWSGPNGTGSVVPPTGAVTYTSDEPAIATVDPTSGAVTAVAPGVTNINGVDAGTGLKASDVITVTPGVTPPTAVSATLTLQAN